MLSARERGGAKETRNKRKERGGGGGAASKQRGKMGYGDMGEGAAGMGDNTAHKCHQNSYPVNT